MRLCDIKITNDTEVWGQVSRLFKAHVFYNQIGCYFENIPNGNLLGDPISRQVIVQVLFQFKFNIEAQINENKSIHEFADID
jgi:hypothetical protein